MNSSSKVFEKEIYELWKKHNHLSDLNSINGDNITIIDPGTQNDDIAGPDFRNARVRIGNLTFVGDVEIDSNYIDWKSHGHNIDSKYNKVILHVSLHNNNNQPYVYTKDGRKVPCVALDRFLPKELNIAAGNDDEEEENSLQHLKCSNRSEEINSEIVLKFVSSLGIERFKKKCSRIYNRLKELKYLKELHAKEPVVTYDLTPAFQERVFVHTDFHEKDLWEQLLYELLFEALGYSKNKGIMLCLAQHANIEFLKTLEGEENYIEMIESALLNIGGLIPENLKIADPHIAEYTALIKNNWEKIRPGYDSRFFEEAQWHFFRIRPQNFPTIRIAGGARIIKKLLKENLIQMLKKKIEEIHNITVLTNSLRSVFVIKSEGFWRHHYVFNQPSNGEVKYFIGSNRADEILINVILPYFSVYFDIFGKKEASKKVFAVYNKFSQATENKIIHNIADSLNLNEVVHTTVYSQGMTELFRSYCSKNKCLECEIGKVIFN